MLKNIRILTLALFVMGVLHGECTNKFNAEECAICLEKFSETPEQDCYDLPCGHTFHLYCLLKFISHPTAPSLTQLFTLRNYFEKKCPICKTNIEIDLEGPAGTLLKEKAYRALFHEFGVQEFANQFKDGDHEINMQPTIFVALDIADEIALLKLLDKNTYWDVLLGALEQRAPEKYLELRGECINEFNAEECVICLEKFSETPEQDCYDLPCGHTFHLYCLLKFISYPTSPSLTQLFTLRKYFEKKCPICKVNIEIDLEGPAGTLLKEKAYRALFHEFGVQEFANQFKDGDHEINMQPTIFVALDIADEIALLKLLDKNTYWDVLLGALEQRAPEKYLELRKKNPEINMIKFDNLHGKAKAAFLFSMWQQLSTKEQNTYWTKLSEEETAFFKQMEEEARKNLTMLAQALHEIVT